MECLSLWLYLTPKGMPKPRAVSRCILMGIGVYLMEEVVEGGHFHTVRIGSEFLITAINTFLKSPLSSLGCVMWSEPPLRVRTCVVRCRVLGTSQIHVIDFTTGKAVDTIDLACLVDVDTNGRHRPRVKLSFVIGRRDRRMMEFVMESATDSEELLFLLLPIAVGDALCVRVSV